MNSKFATILVAAAIHFLAWGAQAQTGEIESRVLARRMADDGATLYESGQYEEARERFHRANALFPAPALELWEARSLNKLLRLVEAEERYASVKRYSLRPEDSAVVRASVAEATSEVEKLRKRIPTITIQLRGATPSNPSVVVRLAEKILNPAMIGLPIPTDPSTPTVVLISNGVELRRETVTLNEGDHCVLVLDAVAPAPAVAHLAQGDQPVPGVAAPVYKHESNQFSAPQPWYRRRDVGWAITGVGAAGLATGIATGLMAVSKHESLSNSCPNHSCESSSSDDLNEFHTYRTISTIGYVVGVVGLGTGITILVLSAKTSKAPIATSLSVRVNPNVASFDARF
jgi:hypothetical protein